MKRSQKIRRSGLIALLAVTTATAAMQPGIASAKSKPISVTRSEGGTAAPNVPQASFIPGIRW